MQDVPIFSEKLKNRGAILAIELASPCPFDVPWSVTKPSAPWNAQFSAGKILKGAQFSQLWGKCSLELNILNSVLLYCCLFQHLRCHLLSMADWLIAERLLSNVNLAWLWGSLS